MLRRIRSWLADPVAWPDLDPRTASDAIPPAPLMDDAFDMPLRVFGPDAGQCVIVDANNFEVVGLLTRDRANAIVRAVNAQHASDLRAERAARERFALIQSGGFQ